MKILLGIDAASHCEETVSALLAMPWPQGTKAVLVSAVAPSEHLYAPEPHVVASAGGVLDLIEEDYVQTHAGVLDRMQQRLREAGIETETRLKPGDPRHLLVEMAAAENADLVVVGCHGHTNLGRRLMGSVATYVVSHAPCNVLVMKCDAEHEES